MLLRARCALCDAAIDWDWGALCGACVRDLPRPGEQCRRCAEPLPGGGLCGRCQRAPPPIDRTVVALAYGYPVDHLVHLLKFRRGLELGRPFGRLLAGAVRDSGGAPPDCLVPVPLHWRRQAARGYNQALLIAAQIGGQLGVPVRPSLCRRIRETPAQSGQDRRARLANVRGSFAVNVPAGVRSVAIVDDVVTTGATAGAMASALRRAGAQHVELWACARAQGAR
ncbi:MAG: ComF family protein [Gammaproteobacteria bacterium]|nr:ComF family protein [Gammaproteobacteria bacterium]